MAENQTLSLTIRFTVVADEQHPADPATLGEVNRSVAQQFREAGFTVEWPYTGEKGGEVLEAIKDITTAAWENREVIAAIATSITTIIGAFIKIQQRQKDRRREPIVMRIKMTNCQGTSLEIEGSDKKSLDNAFEEAKKHLPDFVEQLSREEKPQIIAKMQQPKRKKR